MVLGEAVSWVDAIAIHDNAPWVGPVGSMGAEGCSECLAKEAVKARPSMSLSPGWIKLGTEPLALLDAPTGAPAWPAAFAIERTPAAPAPVPAGPALEVTAAGGPTLDAAGAASLRSAVLAAVEAVVAAEADLTAWDAVAGDGDCGPEHRRFAFRACTSS